ncbi:MAG: SagB/ThcOx family dehydrogenase [Candidatus Ratteibacteria bacterium]
MKSRRSVREYKQTPITLNELSQILWAVNGKTSDWGGRTSPSAGATYPIEIYLVAGNIKDVEAGLYHYQADLHTLKLVKAVDLREALSRASLNQLSVKNAPATIVISGIFERTTSRYGERGIRYVLMEAGHCGQNTHIQAEALGLGSVMIGAFDDEKVKTVLGIEEDIFLFMPCR